MNLPDGSVVKNLPVNVGDTGDAGSIPELGRSSAEGNGNPLQYYCLKNPMDRESWWDFLINFCLFDFCLSSAKEQRREYICLILLIRAPKEDTKYVCVTWIDEYLMKIKKPK